MYELRRCWTLLGRSEIAGTVDQRYAPACTSSYSPHICAE
jgi:hypothetical protein